MILEAPEYTVDPTTPEFTIDPLKDNTGKTCNAYTWAQGPNEQIKLPCIQLAAYTILYFYDGEKQLYANVCHYHKGLHLKEFVMIPCYGAPLPPLSWPTSFQGYKKGAPKGWIGSL